MAKRSAVSGRGAKGKAESPLLVTGKAADKVRNRELKRAIELFNEAIRSGLDAAFPRDLSPQSVHDHLAQHVAVVGAAGATGQARKLSVAQVATLERRATETLTRLGDLVDSHYPHGVTERVHFFPAAENSAPSLGAQLTAMADGIAKEGLPGLPEGMTEETLRALGEEMDAAESDRDVKQKAKREVTVTRGSLGPRTRAIYQRLAALVRGHYGRNSEKLARFGLTPRLAPTGKRNKKKRPGGAE